MSFDYFDRLLIYCTKNGLINLPIESKLIYSFLIHSQIKFASQAQKFELSRRKIYFHMKIFNIFHLKTMYLNLIKNREMCNFIKNRIIPFY